MRAHPWTILLGLALLSTTPALAGADGPTPLSLAADGKVGSPRLELVQRTDAGMTLSLEIPSLEVGDAEVGAESFKDLSLPGGGHRGLVGEPALPTYTRLVALPAGVGVQARLLDHRRVDLGALRLVPNRGIEDQQKAGAPSFDAVRYRAAGARDVGVEVGEPALMHGVRVVPVTFSPVAYDPATGQAQAATRMEVELSFSGRDHRNDPSRTSRMIPESFLAMFEDDIIGYQRDADVATGPGTYLVICPNNTAVVDILEPLLEWRRRQGYNVVLATTAQTGTTATAIKSWLQQQYSNLDPALEFVTLVGDANGAITVPSWREGYSGYNGEGDHDYTTLDGGDVLSDVHIGRLSVTSTTELNNVVNKIVAYESDPDMSDPSWFTTAGLVGDPSASGVSTIWVNQFVKEQLLDLGYTRIDTIWGGSYLSQMMATINQGETVFCYRGYLGMSGMSSGHIASLSNGRQLPFALIPTCDTGSFWSDTNARSEAFLRAPNGGGIASIGTATIGTHTRYNNSMFLGIMNGLLNSSEHRVGPALTRGKLNLYRNYWANEWQNVWVWSTWNSLMGDPATEIYTGVPAGITVAYPTSLALGANALPVDVTLGGQPVAGARVAAYQAGNVHAFGYTDDAGQVVLDIAGAAGGDVLVTVTGTNLLPHLGATAIGPVARSLDFASLTIQEVAGNSNGVANPGETLDLQIGLINHGTNTVTGAEAMLGSNDDTIVLLDADASYGTVAPGATVTRTFRVRLESDAAGGAVIPLRLDATAGADGWTSLVSLTVNGAHGSFPRFSFGGAGGDVDPGESGTVRFDLANNGNRATAGVSATLTCTSQWVTVTDASGSWGSIGISGSVAQSDAFAISVASDCYPGHLAALQVDLTFAEGNTQTIIYPVVVGTAGVGDPTGPDAYGYYIFDNGDTAPEAPTYDWLEIAGIGANTGISDTHGGDDDVRSFDLPFPFTFYGDTHERVSICSNGWLSLGPDTYQRLYRGWVMPAEGGPGSMIAAFWDDLAGGSVYTYHDVANHRYIVQWDAFGASSNSGHDYFNGDCTFQVVLYDPAHHATDTGDGIIEIFYQSVAIYGDESSYFATGIQNADRSDGITYAYGNNYSGGAATVQAGRALRIVPVVPQAQGFLAGEVTNASAGGLAIEGALVSLVDGGRTIATGADGIYSGSVPVGTWDVAVYHDSFAPDTVLGVTIAEGQTAEVDFELADIRGPYIEDVTQLGDTQDTAGPYVVEALVNDMTGVSSRHLVYTSSTGGGPFVLPLTVIDALTGLVRGQIPGQPDGTRVQYWITAEDVLGNTSAAPAGAPWPTYSFVVSSVSEIVFDDCEVPGAWTVDPLNNDTATTGIWEHGDPIGTYEDLPVQPEDDHTPDPGVNCWFTGQHTPGQSSGYNDIDNGVTTIDSPTYDVSGLGTVAVTYWRWFSNDQGNSPGEDPWVVQVSGNGGGTWATVENTTASSSEWQQVSFVVNDLVANPTAVKLRFQAADYGAGSLVEAAVDDLTISASTTVADLLAPTVTVQSPSGGVYANGQNLAVAWTASDDVGVVHARVRLSLDGGVTYPLLLAEGPLDGSLDWTVDVPSDQASYAARVRVEVLDGQERLASALSGAFTIEPGTTAAPEVPRALALDQNHPNPFNPQTVIGFSVPRAQDVRLKIYDVQGKLVRTLVSGRLEAGVHQVTWRGRDDRGGQVASGLYFYRLTSDDGEHVRKMTLLK